MRGIEVRLGEREWQVAGQVWAGRPRPALYPRFDGGVAMLLDPTFAEDDQPIDAARAVTRRHRRPLHRRARRAGPSAAVLPDGSVIVEHNFELVRVHRVREAPPAVPPTRGAPSTSSIASAEEPTEVTVPTVTDWLVQRSDQVVFVVAALRRRTGGWRR